MAKGLRSSVKKANKAKLRSRVFRPVEDARTERLSAKLLELSSKPQPEVEKETKVDDEPKGGEGRLEYCFWSIGGADVEMQHKSASRNKQIQR